VVTALLFMNNWAVSESSSPPRAERAAARIVELAVAAGVGTRLGSRDELRVICGVSIGTLHEALRLLQSTGEIVVRTGPGGGVFAGERSALADLVRAVRRPLAPDFPQVARILTALSPLVIADAVAALDDAGARSLRERLAAIVAARAEGSGAEGLRGVAHASLELFATIASLPDDGILRAVTGTTLAIQISALPTITGPVTAHWGALVDRHVAAVTEVVDAICAGDPSAASAARSTGDPMEFFRALADDGHG